MKQALLYIGISVFASGCISRSFLPEEGDLYFQVCKESGFTEAIAEVTEGMGGVKFTHVGIATYENGHPCILEATTEGGVKLTALADFLSAAATVGNSPAVAVFRIREPKRMPPAKAVGRARQHIGKPYDDSFLPDNDAMYCSELVYESFRDTLGHPVFTARPMTFRPPGDSLPSQLWRDYFIRLGIEIPEGVSGTNPGDMSKDEAIEIVYRYFR